MDDFTGSQLFNTRPIFPSRPENSEFFCLAEDHQARWDGLNTFIAIVFGVIGAFITFGTLIDVMNTLYGKDKSSPTFGLKLLLSFSIYTNFKELMSTETKVFLIRLMIIIKRMTISWDFILGLHSYLT